FCKLFLQNPECAEIQPPMLPNPLRWKPVRKLTCLCLSTKETKFVLILKKVSIKRELKSKYEISISPYARRDCRDHRKPICWRSAIPSFGNERNPRGTTG